MEICFVGGLAVMVGCLVGYATVLGIKDIIMNCCHEKEAEEN